MLTHRVTSPLLLGLSSANGFSSNADEIVNASNLFHNIVIKPYQLLITESLEDIFSKADINLSLYFKTIEPLEFIEIDKGLDKEIIEEETGVKVEEQKEFSKDESLTEEEEKSVLGSLADSGEVMSEEYVFVDEIDEDSDDENEDWANYLITEKKGLLSKIKKFADVISSKKKGNVFSVLDSPNGLYKIRYKYAVGSRKPMEEGNESRDFCKNMMGMTNRNVVWTIEDIDRATDQGVNRSFGHKGRSYSLFKFKGGIYCRHKFVKVLYRLESNTEPSNNLEAYKKTRKIPKRYDRNPSGSKQAKIAPENMPKRGAYPK